LYRAENLEEAGREDETLALSGTAGVALPDKSVGQGTLTYLWLCSPSRQNIDEAAHCGASLSGVFC